MNTASPEKTGETLADASLAASTVAQKESFSGSRLLFNMAAQEFGVVLEGTEEKDWEGLLAGSYLVDHLLDIEKADMVAQIKSILAGDLRDDLSLKPQNSFRSYMLKQSEVRYNDIMAQLERVTPMVHRQADAKKANEVVAVRLEEADLLTYLLSLTVEGRVDASARQEFNSWLGGWSRSGYMFDSLVDMKRDYANGDSGVKPTLSAQMIIAKAAIKESLTAARKTPPRLLGRCAMVGVRYVLLNVKPDLTQKN